MIDGDTGAPVGGVEVSGLRGGAVVARATSDGAGRTTLPLGVGVVTADPHPYSPARARVQAGAAEVGPVRPAPAEPQYGGGPARDRSVPGVRAGPPSGRPAWRFQSRTLLEFPPAVRDGLVVIGNNAGRVYAVDAGSGKLRWARRQRGEIASTPAITQDAVYMSSMDGSLVRYGLGTPRWTFSSSGSPIESSPLVVGGLVYVGAHDGRLYAVDARTGRARWTFQAPAAIKGSAALAGRLVVVGDYAGRVHALDARTGAERWTYSGGVRFYGGPGVSGGTIVIGDVGGAVVALDARDGSELWRHSTGGAFVYSSPAIAGGAVFIGSYDGVFRALDLASGALRWSFDVGGPISGSATVVDGVVYVSRLYAPGQAPRAPTASTRSRARCARRSTTAATRRGGRRAHPVPRGNPDPACVSRARAVGLSGSGPARWRWSWSRRASSAWASSGAGSTPAASRGRPWASSRPRRRAGSATRARGPSSASTPGAPAPTRRSISRRPSGDAGRAMPARCWSSRRCSAGGRAIVGTNAGLALAIDLTSGRELWSVDLHGRVASSPAIGGRPGPVHHQAGRGAGPRGGHRPRVWRRVLGSASESSPLVVAGSAYLGEVSGRVHAPRRAHRRACSGRRGPRGPSRRASR